MTYRSETMAAVVLALLAVNLLSVIRQKTITNDEFIHIPAGYYHLVDRAFQFNNEHPPLVKIWAALPLLLVQPYEQPLPDLSQADSDKQTWTYVAGFWGANEKLFERIAFWPRVMMVALTLALGVVIYVYARALFNSRAALCAVVLYSIEPNVLAHGRVVHTDIAATLAYLCFFGALYAYERSSTWLRAGLVGVAFGGALVTKFSMIVLAPLLVCLVVARLFGAARREGAARGRLLRHAAFASLVGLVVVNCAYGFKSPPLTAPDAQWIASQPTAVFAPFMHAFNFFSQLLPTHYLFGLYKVLLHNHNGHPASLLGSHSDFGWWYYFPVAFALKTTLPFLLLSAAAIVWMLRRLLLGRQKIFLYLLVPLIVYTFICVTSRINIGIRHFLPAFPFLFIAGGALLDRLFRTEGRGRVPAAVLGALILLWAGAEAARAYPDYIPYMNQLAGQHPRWKYLSDSNVEWGDDVPALAAYLRARGEREVSAVLLGGWGTLRFFGVQYHDLLAPPEVKRPDTRYVAIGASFLNGSTVTGGVEGRLSNDARINFFDAYRTRQPEAVFGHSIYLYRVRE
ncbi:MAG TPA: glycosyltransferase family 39 protein [Pyrinomonadaceae bacterium]|nr:glycosyltransferase family 39 protein [Pyrinomonadaceae bacterium]